MPKKQKPKWAGFRTMDPAEVKDIAKLGGETISRDRAHMSEIGKRGVAIRAKKRRLEARNKAERVQAKKALAKKVKSRLSYGCAV